MNPVLSPKELAQAIGVSESSLKRWADDGRIRVSRTAGGHRRIPIAEAIRFIRESQATIVRPDVLGLPDLEAVSDGNRVGDDDAERLHAYLKEGRGHEARGLILSMYLAGRSVAAISDGPIASAFHRLGSLWQEHEEGIFLEHRASEICLEAVRQLHTTIDPQISQPAAVGGAPPKDTCALTSAIAATVLAAEGFHAVNLGAQTPFESFLQAADHHEAALVWMSVTHADAPESLEPGLAHLAQQLAQREIKLIIGGDACDKVRLPKGDNVYVGHSMGELAAFVKGLQLGGRLVK